MNYVHLRHRICWEGRLINFAIMIRVFFDTETTGLPRSYDMPMTVPEAALWDSARLVQLSWIVDRDGDEIGMGDFIVRPDGFQIPAEATAVHGITTEEALEKGVPAKQAVYYFLGAARMADEVVGHNTPYDMGVVGAELLRYWGKNYIASVKTRDTMRESVDFCRIAKANGSGWKWPKLMELYQKLFGCEFEGAHDSLADITATRDCFWELKRRNVIL